MFINFKDTIKQLTPEGQLKQKKELLEYYESHKYKNDKCSCKHIKLFSNPYIDRYICDITKEECYKKCKAYDFFDKAEIIKKEIEKLLKKGEIK